MAIKEPKVRVDIELGHNNALACFTTITVNVTDTVEHQHIINGQFRVTGAE